MFIYQRVLADSSRKISGYHGDMIQWWDIMVHNTSISAWMGRYFMVKIGISWGQNWEDKKINTDKRVWCHFFRGEAEIIWKVIRSLLVFQGATKNQTTCWPCSHNCAKTCYDQLQRHLMFKRSFWVQSWLHCFWWCLMLQLPMFLHWMISSCVTMAWYDLCPASWLAISHIYPYLYIYFWSDVATCFSIDVDVFRMSDYTGMRQIEYYSIPHL